MLHHEVDVKQIQDFLSRMERFYQRDREREKERQRDRETEKERETDRETGKEREKEKQRDRERDRDRERKREISTITYKIFETNSSFHVKQRTTGKV